MKAAILVILGLCVAAGAQERPATGVSRIEGIVLNAVGGQPVPGARLALRPEGIARSTLYLNTSGADGRFFLKDIPPGRYRLTATRQTFIDGKFGQRRTLGEGTVLDLTSPQTVTNLEIRLTPGAVITGKAVDEKGSPLEGVAVALLQRTYRTDGSVVLSAVITEETDDLGEYRIHDVPPGAYLLLAVAIPRVTLHFRTTTLVDQSDEPDMFAPTYYPNSIDPSGGSLLQVEAGTHMSGIDFSLTHARPLRISGVVLNHITGEPMAGEDVNLRRKMVERTMLPMPRESVRTDSQGNFGFSNAVPGEYIVSVDTSSPGFHSFTDSQDITLVDRAISDVQIVPKPYPSVTGQVVLDQNNFVTNDHGTLRFTNTNNELHPNEYDVGFNDDGTFQLTNMAPGIYRITLMGFPADAFIRAATGESQDALRSGLDLRHGSEDHLRVIIAPNGATVDGSVQTDNTSLPTGAQILLLPSDRSRMVLFKTTTADQSGQFAFRGISPGSYRLFAFDDLEPNIYFDPSFIEKYESRGISVQVDEAGHATVRLTAIPTVERRD
jgi:hypothetical protein